MHAVAIHWYRFRLAAGEGGTADGTAREGLATSMVVVAVGAASGRFVTVARYPPLGTSMISGSSLPSSA
jgi:hypothetical protein